MEVPNGWHSFFRPTPAERASPLCETFFNSSRTKKIGLHAWPYENFCVLLWQLSQPRPWDRHREEASASAQPPQEARRERPTPTGTRANCRSLKDLRGIRRGIPPPSAEELPSPSQRAPQRLRGETVNASAEASSTPPRRHRQCLRGGIRGPSAEAFSPPNQEKSSPLHSTRPTPLAKLVEIGPQC